MTVTIRKEEDDNRQLLLTVEVSEDQVEQAMRRKARQLSNELRIAGFRRGKVPYQVILQRVGAETVRVEAIEDMVQDVFEQALDEAEIEPYGRPVLENMELDPLVLSFTVPLVPVVTLGDYRALRKDIPTVEIAEDAIAEALEEVQASHQVLEAVERPIAAGDVATIKGRGELTPQPAEAEGEGEEGESGAETAVPSNEILFDEESVDLLMDAARVFAGTPFVENLLGKSAGDEVSFSFVFPADFEEDELAGREGIFNLTVLEVKSRTLPELDDELAKLEGEYETLEELRADLADNLQRRAEDQAKEDLIEQTITDLLEGAELHYPPTVLEEEIDDMVESFRRQIGRSGWNVDDYMTIQGETEASMREQFRERAEERLERRLVLRQFIFDEKLRVDADDVSELVDKRLARYDNEELREQMRNYFVAGAGFDMISSEVLSEKVHARMAAILSGEAPDLADLEVDETSAVDEEE